MNKKAGLQTSKNPSGATAWSGKAVISQEISFSNTYKHCQKLNAVMWNRQQTFLLRNQLVSSASCSNDPFTRGEWPRITLKNTVWTQLPGITTKAISHSVNRTAVRRAHAPITPVGLLLYAWPDSPALKLLLPGFQRAADVRGYRSNPLQLHLSGCLKFGNHCWHSSAFANSS